MKVKSKHLQTIFTMSGMDNNAGLSLLLSSQVALPNNATSAGTIIFA
jgi:hypothetical protein